MAQRQRAQPPQPIAAKEQAALGRFFPSFLDPILGP